MMHYVINVLLNLIHTGIDEDLTPLAIEVMGCHFLLGVMVLSALISE